MVAPVLCAAMIRRYQPTSEPVTMGHVRSHGCRELLVYCTSIWCNHSAKINADWLPDEAALLALEPRMVCTVCGLIGADFGRTGPRTLVAVGWVAFTASGTRAS